MGITVDLEENEGCVVFRLDGTIEGHVPNEEDFVIESPMFWTLAVLMMFGRGSGPEAMRETVLAWARDALTELPSAVDVRVQDD